MNLLDTFFIVYFWCIFLFIFKGQPQWIQTSKVSLISFPHFLHFIKAIINYPFYITSTKESLFPSCIKMRLAKVG